MTRTKKQRQLRRRNKSSVNYSAAAKKKRNTTTAIASTMLPSSSVVPADLSTDQKIHSFLSSLTKQSQANAVAGALVPWFCDKLPSSKSRRDYARNLSQFVTHMHFLGIEPLDVTGDDVRLYKEAMQEAQLRPATISQALSTIRGTYEQFGKKGLVEWDRVSDIQAVESPVVKKNSTPCLTHEEACALLHAPDTRTLIGVRDHAMLFTFFATAYRSSAVAQACVGHIEWSNHQYYLNAVEKGNNEIRKALLEATPAVMHYIDAAEIADDKAGPLFRPLAKNRKEFERRHLTGRAILKLIKKYGREVGLDVDPIDRRGFCTHSLRKTSANDALRHGAPLPLVQSWLDHKDIRTTQEYVDYRESDSEEAARYSQIR